MAPAPHTVSASARFALNLALSSAARALAPLSSDRSPVRKPSQPVLTWRVCPRAAGGAERLVVDAGLAMTQHGHRAIFYTSHHDPAHCFQETRDGAAALRVTGARSAHGGRTASPVPAAGSVEVRVRGSFLPRTIFGKCHALCAIVRNLWAALALLAENAASAGDVAFLFVDQLSVAVPLLRLLARPIVFYCHFPDMLLTQRKSLLKHLYRLPIDAVEQFTTGAQRLAPRLHPLVRGAALVTASLPATRRCPRPFRLSSLWR
jgi:hypothetical protein